MYSHMLGICDIFMGILGASDPYPDAESSKLVWQ